MKTMLSDYQRGRITPQILAHLIDGLAQAGRFEELAVIIESPKWLRAHKAHDLLMLLNLADVERGLTIAEEKGKAGLPWLVGWSLLDGFLRSRISLIPEESFMALVRLGQVDRAERLLSLQTVDWFKQRVSLKIAKYFQEQGDFEASQRFLKQSITIALAYQIEAAQKVALEGIVQFLISIGDNETLDSARHLIGESQLSPQGMISLSTQIAEGYANIGNAVQARDILDLSLQRTQLIRDCLLRANELVTIAVALSNIGEKEHAQSVVKQAWADVEKSETRLSYHWLITLSSVVGAMVQVGEKEQAHEMIPQLLAYAGEETASPQMVYEKLGEHLTAAGDLEGLLMLYERLDQIEDEDDKETASIILQGYFEQSGYYDMTDELFSEFDDDSWHSRIWTARKSLKKGEDETGWRILMEVYSEIEQAEWEADAFTLRDLAEGLVEVGELGRARTLLPHIVTAPLSLDDDDDLEDYGAFDDDGLFNQEFFEIFSQLADEMEHASTTSLSSLESLIISTHAIEFLRDAYQSLQTDVEDAQAYAEAMGAIANIATQMNDFELAEQSLGNSLRAVPTIHRYDQVEAQVFYLNAMAIELHRSGLDDLAGEAIDRAMDVLRMSEHLSLELEQPTATLVQLLGEMGDVQRLHMFHKYIESSGSDDFFYHEKLVELARSFYKAGQQQKALIILRELLDKIVQSDDGLSGNLLNNLSLAMLEMGNVEGLETIMQILRGIPDAEERFILGASLSPSLLQANELEFHSEMIRWLTKVEPNNEWLLEPFAELVEYISKSHNEKALEQINDIAYRIFPRPDLHAIALAHIAVGYYTLGFSEKVQSILRTAYLTAQISTEKKGKRLHALVEVANAIVRTGGTEDAISILRQLFDTPCPSADELLDPEVFDKILQIIVTLKNEELLQLVSDIVLSDNPVDPDDSYLAIASAQARLKGDRKGLIWAWKIMEEVSEHELYRGDLMKELGKFIAEDDWTEDEMISFIAESLRWARIRGQSGILWHIGALSPIFGKLNIVPQIWQKIKDVESLLHVNI